MEIKLFGNPDYPQIIQADPCVRPNATRLIQVANRITPGCFCFLVREEASVRGTETLTQGSRLVLTEWGNILKYTLPYPQHNAKY